MTSGKVMGTVALFAIVLCLATVVHSRQSPRVSPRGGPLAAIPISLVVRDGNGNIVGNVLDVDGARGFGTGFGVSVAATLVEVELPSGDRANVILRIARDSGIGAAMAIATESAEHAQNLSESMGREGEP